MLNIVPKQQLESARIELAQALAGKSELIASRDAMEEHARVQAQRANALERAVQECCVELGLLQQEVGRQQDGYRQALEDAKQRAEHDRIRAEALEEELGRLRVMVDAARCALSTEAQHAEVVDTMTELPADSAGMICPPLWSRVHGNWWSTVDTMTDLPPGEQAVISPLIEGLHET